MLKAAGVQGNFSSHSFRIGAATVAAANGVPDHRIQQMGRWTSNAFAFFTKKELNICGAVMSHYFYFFLCFFEVFPF